MIIFRVKLRGNTEEENHVGGCRLRSVIAKICWKILLFLLVMLTRSFITCVMRSFSLMIYILA